MDALQLIGCVPTAILIEYGLPDDELIAQVGGGEAVTS